VSEETDDGFRLKSAEHIGVSVGPTARPVMIFCPPRFRCPPAPKFPKRFSREKRKRLRAAWVEQKRNEHIWRTVFPAVLERSIEFMKELPQIGVYRRPITVEKTP